MAAPKGNKYALGNHGGRPPLYETVETLEKEIAAYFEYCLGEFHEEQEEETTGRGRNKKTITRTIRVCDREPERPSWTRLALYLGFSGRDGLSEYAKKEEFSYPIKRALSVIEGEYEDLLPYAKGNGVVFALKNFDWKDRKEVDNRFIGRTIVRPDVDGSIIIEEQDESEEA